MNFLLPLRMAVGKLQTNSLFLGGEPDWSIAETTRIQHYQINYAFKTVVYSARETYQRRVILANVKATPLISLGPSFIWITLMFLGPIPLYASALSKVKVIRWLNRGNAFVVLWMVSELETDVQTCLFVD